MVSSRRIRGVDDLGAWLVKGNADHVDLAGRFAREPRVTRWCVQPSYRLGLMRAGQPVLFWASGSRRRDLAYGIWGLGRLTGPPRQDDGWAMPLDLVVAEPGGRLPREELRADPRLAGLEVLRQPQGANPSFVDVEEFAVIRELLGVTPGGGAGPRPAGQARPGSG
ncbi:hypothetical protein AB0M54_39185 [Actinoplanes sp. NPDC051470]|uniref:hypothetical protein n=1 Tax=Actinoplanes sp. NPDC051470 TaxID=3157224 RepID=UPI00343302A3